MAPKMRVTLKSSASSLKAWSVESCCVCHQQFDKDELIFYAGIIANNGYCATVMSKLTSHLIKEIPIITFSLWCTRLLAMQL